MRWSGVIAVEGERTVDGRFIEHGALVWDLDDPLLLVQYVPSEMHNDWQPIGTVETIERDGRLIRATGTLHTTSVGDSCEMGADGLVISDDEDRRVIEARIRYVAIGSNPAWPQCRDFKVLDDAEAVDG